MQTYKANMYKKSFSELLTNSIMIILLRNQRVLISDFMMTMMELICGVFYGLADELQINVKSVVAEGAPTHVVGIRRTSSTIGWKL